MISIKWIAWLFKRNIRRDLSELLVILILLVLINITNPKFILNHPILILPYFLGVLVISRILQIVIDKLIGRYNREIKLIYFVLVITVTSFVGAFIK